MEFGTFVEIGETYLPGQPKYHRDRKLGTTWKAEDKLALKLTQCGSLDVIVKEFSLEHSMY